MANRWEWLHRLSSAHTVIKAVLGSTIVVSLVRAASEFFKQPVLPWWGDLCVGGFFAAVLVLFLALIERRPKTEASMDNTRQIVPIPESLNFEDQGRGYELQSAFYGAPHHKPIDVTPKVKELIASGNKSIPVNWGLLTRQTQEPIPYVLKSMVLTFSITYSEGKELFLPTPAPTAHLEQPEDDLKGVPDSRYHFIRNKYPQQWQQRFALKRIWDRPNGIPREELVLGLKNSTFTGEYEPDVIVSLLLQNKALVEWDGKDIWIKDSEVRQVLTYIFKKEPLC